MAENIAENTLSTEEKSEENQKDAEVVHINVGKLLKIRHNISKLGMLRSLSKELKDYKEACTEIKTLIGELNDIEGGKEGS